MYNEQNKSGEGGKMNRKIYEKKCRVYIDDY